MLLKDIIIRYREVNNLSQRAFAARCNVTNGYISMLENGKNPSTGKPVIPSLAKLSKIAEGMDMTLQQLLQSADDMEIDISNADHPEGNDTLSPEALRLAAIYDSLDDTGKEAVTAVTDSQVKRIEKYGRCTDSPKRIPILGTACQDGTVEVKYAARKEQKELEHTQTPVLSD